MGDENVGEGQYQEQYGDPPDPGGEPAPEFNPSEALHRLAVEARESFTADPSSPSVVVSVLAPQSWYASVVRYRRPFGEGKEVVVSHKSTTFIGALRGLSKKWEELP